MSKGKDLINSIKYGLYRMLTMKTTGEPEIPVHRNWRSVSLYMYLITRKSPYGWKICVGERNATIGVTWK